MRYLGVDYGSRRIGLALSDPPGKIAFPLEVVPATELGKAVEAIAQIARDNKADELVVGLPVNMNGTEGAAAAAARSFAARLRKRTGLPVHLWDERLSTASAEWAMREGNLSQQRRAERVDKVAAQMILQQFLDHSPQAGKNHQDADS
jgi:putative Holliday junction resolvase